MASNLVLSGLPDYVKVHSDELLVKSTLDFRTARYVDIMPNVKFKDSIPTLDSTIEVQDGAACGFNPSGTDTFGERFVSTVAAKVEKQWCAKDWEKKYGNYQLLWEAGRETLPFEEKLTNSQLNLIQERIEEIVWQGDATIGVDGFIKNIEDESALTISVSAVTSATSISDAIDAVVAAVPEAAIKKGVNVFLSTGNLRKYILAQNAVCCGNRPVQDAAAETIGYIGDSRVTLVGVYGIGDATIVAASKDALVYATDIENAENRYDLWFDRKDETFDFRVLWRMGTALRYPEEVVIAQFA